jgi:HSP90 family molecular chaperone
MEFQAETRKLLDIVTNSIYTDKEVFMRELISNASDALEKYRYKAVNNEVVGGDIEGGEINIITNQTNNTLTIEDNGIGMTRDELIGNLGTIARSGSKAFVQNAMEEGGDSSKDKTDGIIGQFGVGFYSSFMVSDAVAVESVSALKSEDGDVMPANAHRWSSDGTGQFNIEEVGDSGLVRGSRIVMNLKDEHKDFADENKIKDIIKKYSNFVSFPIKVNGEAVNTVSAIWTEDKSTLTKQQYTDFYKFLSNAFDEPKYTIHFRADAPLDLKCLFFVPTFHTEKFGMGRIEPGVNLYSRKVLIESKPQDLLPDWLRFVKGVVDSEDLPLSLSREKPQDSRLLGRIRDVLTRKIVRFLEDEKKRRPEAFKEFYTEYSFFLKEGVCHDFKFMDQISKLLMFESSKEEAGILTSFDDYIGRCSPEQKEIYYLVAPSREAALMSPYYEQFKKSGVEVLFLYQTIDDFVMRNVNAFNGRTLVSAETSSVDLDKEDKAEKDGEESTGAKLSEEEVTAVCSWIKTALGEARVREVKSTTRLSESPACVTDHESGALRRMMKMVDQSNAGAAAAVLPPQILEINADHAIIQTLSAVHKQDNAEMQAVAKLVAEQVLDNALIAAGLIDDPRAMLPRLNSILESTLKR